MAPRMPGGTGTCSLGRIGPSPGCGTVFKLDTSGNKTVLHSFTGSDGAGPAAGLIMDAAGNLYGTTAEGGFGAGTVFKVDTSGNETVLHSFTGSDGSGPDAGLIMDQAGNLYGTTSSGGSAAVGTVFKIDTSGNETVLYSFKGGSDGARPEAGLIMDQAGNLYGTTLAGGAGTCSYLHSGCGTVFKLGTSNNETVLYEFTGSGGDGANPFGTLIMDQAGNLYGTTLAGGAGTCSSLSPTPGCGTVFKLDTSGQETVLHSFTNSPDGAAPSAGLLLDAGNLYGTTFAGGAFGPGTVFKLDASGHETVLHSFNFADGSTPAASLIMDTAGNLYGTTIYGGAFNNCSGGCGTVFKLAVQAPPPTITSISPTSAIAGGAGFTLTVNGTNFVSGSTVNFNGSSLATTFVSSTQLTAAIPASDIAIAGTFNVTVTNSGGVTSNAVSFIVVTPQDETGAIINSVNVLLSQGVINGGQNNSLVTQLQHAITMMNAGKNAGAIGNLDSFISEVNDLLSSGVLSPSQAASLINAVKAVIAPLS